MIEPISTDNLIQHIHDLMKKGKDSRIKGWVMQDILENVYNNWGLAARNFAYKYITENYCNIKSEE